MSWLAPMKLPPTVDDTGIAVTSKTKTIGSYISVQIETCQKGTTVTPFGSTNAGACYYIQRHQICHLG